MAACIDTNTKTTETAVATVKLPAMMASVQWADTDNAGDNLICN